MNKNIKALLLSAFLLPGMGQLYKGEKVKGAIYLLLVNIFLLASIFIVLKKNGGFPPDSTDIRQRRGLEAA